jgi:predicted ATPase
LSEGTFRALALLFYIVRGKRDLLLLEEPEVCVHHGLLDSVVAAIKEYSRDRQIVLSTHSDAVLDMLSPESVRLVRANELTGTRVVAVSTALSSRSLRALKEYLHTTGTLGEYWKHSGFEE